MGDLPKTVWGVDPGITGAVCAVSRFADGYVCRTVKMPVDKVLRPGRSSQTVPNIPEFTAKIIDLNREFPPSRIVMEKVNALPKQGVVSMFRFGWVAGAMEGVIRAVTHGRRRSIMWTYAYPTAWKRTYGLSDSTMTRHQRKEKAVEVANWLVAEVGVETLPFVGQSDADVAEAFLLACSGFYELNKKLIEHGKEQREANIIRIIDSEHENDLVIA